MQAYCMMCNYTLAVVFKFLHCITTKFASAKAFNGTKCSHTL